MKSQLTLNIQLRDDATFANFFDGNNSPAVHFLKTRILQKRESLVYLWGNPHCGRSHLLQACCHAASVNRLSSLYLPLKRIYQLSPKIFEGIENLSFVCIDDIEAIVGDSLWEEALFHSYNRMNETQACLIVSASVPPSSLSLRLPDLKSRLSAGAVFQLHELEDDQKLQALQMRAKLRGMKLSFIAAQFLLNHYLRDMQNLFSALEKLDKTSLVEKRKISIPFIKAVLEI